MRKPIKTIAIVTLTSTLALSAGVSADPMQDSQRLAYREDRPSAAAMAVDAVAIRPLGVVATVLGTGLFVVSLPFSAIGGNTEEAAQTLIGEPAKVTFKRPLGEFDFRY